MPLHIETPYFQSHYLTQILARPVWLKFESAQPVNSFKIRGIGLMCQRAAEKGSRRLVSSSGGNAGYAVAYAGRRLGLEVVVVVPETTSPFMRGKISGEGAKVLVHGKVWDEADQKARELSRDPKSAYCSPFDHPDIWEGHATIINEMKEQGPKPEAIVVAVGGGGLMCGLLQGLHQASWNDLPVLAVETEGAASLAAAMQAGKLVTLEAITSIAKTLGAKRVAEKAFQWTTKHPVTSWVTSDQAALSACLAFLEQHCQLVEPACGAALSAIYEKAEFLQDKKSVAVIVCGGAAVDLPTLLSWAKQ